MRWSGKASAALGVGAAIIACTTLVHSAGAATAEVVVMQRNVMFSQSNVTLHVGDSIRFTNDDTVPHNISVRSQDVDDTEDLGIQEPHKSMVYRFKTPGVFFVVCSIHPKMNLRVVVR